MFEEWKCPDWGDPWEPEAELRVAKKVAILIQSKNPDLKFSLDTETEGCLFVEIRRGDMLIGTFTSSNLDPDSPLVSMHMGAEEDVFHVQNLDALADIPKHYRNEYTYPDDDQSQQNPSTESPSSIRSG